MPAAIGWSSSVGQAWPGKAVSVVGGASAMTTRLTSFLRNVGKAAGAAMAAATGSVAPAPTPAKAPQRSRALAGGGWYLGPCGLRWPWGRRMPWGPRSVASVAAGHRVGCRLRGRRRPCEVSRATAMAALRSMRSPHDRRRPRGRPYMGHGGAAGHRGLAGPVMLPRRLPRGPPPRSPPAAGPPPALGPHDRPRAGHGGAACLTSGGAAVGGSHVRAAAGAWRAAGDRQVSACRRWQAVGGSGVGRRQRRRVGAWRRVGVWRRVGLWHAMQAGRAPGGGGGRWAAAAVRRGYLCSWGRCGLRGAGAENVGGWRRAEAGERRVSSGFPGVASSAVCGVWRVPSFLEPEVVRRGRSRRVTSGPVSIRSQQN